MLRTPTGPPLSIEEYFQEFTKLREDANDRWEEADLKIAASFGPRASLDERREAVIAYIDEIATITANLGRDMSGLAVPPEVREPHEDYLLNMASFPALLQQVVDGIDRASPEELLGGIGLGIYDSFSGPCAELQGIADQHAIDLDLHWDSRPAC